MTPKRIFILDGHPAAMSLSRTFAETYAQAAADAGHEVRQLHLHDVQFDPDYEFGGYGNWKPLEPALEQVIEHLKWSEHLVLTMPMWWGGMPAKLKGLIDRAFLPGITFDTRSTTWIGMPLPLMTGRSARVIVTSDTPGWFLRLRYRNAILHQLRGQVFGFVGIKPTRFTYFSGASQPKDGAVAQWSAKVQTLGTKAA